MVTSNFLADNYLFLNIKKTISCWFYLTFRMSLSPESTFWSQTIENPVLTYNGRTIGMRFKFSGIAVYIYIDDGMASFIKKQRRLKYLRFCFNCCLECAILYFILRSHHGLLTCIYRLYCFEILNQQHLLEYFLKLFRFFQKYLRVSSTKSFGECKFS